MATTLGIHFYKRFELAILDEVDAFPFQGSEMLRFGLHRSLTPTGQLVEAATPSACRPSRVITIPALPWLSSQTNTVCGEAPPGRRWRLLLCLR